VAEENAGYGPAEKLGLPLGTVKSRIFFTRQKLQQELKDFV
jgi:RNA polymerase sigma-70 factor (ECF subfamily)